MDPISSRSAPSKPRYVAVDQPDDTVQPGDEKRDPSLPGWHPLTAADSEVGTRPLSWRGSHKLLFRRSLSS